MRLKWAAWTLGLLAVGCAPSTEGPVLRVANWGGAGDDGEYDRLVQRLNTEFGQKHGAKVKIEGIPGEYVHKMLLNFVAGSVPDVMTLDASSAAVFVNNGLLMDLTPFIEKDKTFRIDDYYPNVLSIGQREGKTYAIPGDFTPMVMYYNKRLFDQAGVPYPKPGWSFDDFLATSKALTKEGQYGFVFANWMPGWVMWIWNNGGEVLDPQTQKATGTLDSPQNVETITFLRELINTHKVAPSLSQTASMGVDPFASSKAAMTISGHWALVGYKNAARGPDGKPLLDWRDLGVVELPHNTPTSKTVMYQAGYGIPKGAKNPEMAWEYVKAWTSASHQFAYNQSGIAVSARKDVSQRRAVDAVEQDFLKIVPQARPPAGAFVEGYEIVEKVGQSMMDSVLTNGADVKTALTKAAKRIDSEFAKSRP